MFFYTLDEGEDTKYETVRLLYTVVKITRHFSGLQAWAVLYHLLFNTTASNFNLNPQLSEILLSLSMASCDAITFFHIFQLPRLDGRRLEAREGE